MWLEMKNWSYKYDINIPKLRHGDKYTKYKMCFSIMIVLCIKQYLSNIRSSIQEKVKQHWDWVEKTVAYKRSVRTRKNSLTASYELLLS